MKAYDIQKDRYRLDFSKKIPKWLQKRGVKHLLFWSLFVVYEGLIWGMVDGDYTKRTVISLIELPIKILATYFTLYILIDRLLINGKWALFINLLAVSILVFGISLRVLAYYAIYPLYLPEATEVPLFFFPKILIAVFTIYSLVAILATFHMISKWYGYLQNELTLKQTAQKLENKNLESELKLLKSQINPHFLFNTLNNIYTLTLNKSDRAPEVVYKLSELMNYMLYESNKKIVLLEKEIQYIQNYIALEKIRYSSEIDISLDTDGDLKEIYVAPLLILPFVENSFKHGLSRHLSNGWLNIQIYTEEMDLIVRVENSKSQVENGVPETSQSGIGLENVTKRLNLIYPDQHELNIFDEKDTFLVILRIKIKTEKLIPDFDKQFEQIKI